jgi:signal transduction histidine kinase
MTALRPTSGRDPAAVDAPLLRRVRWRLIAWSGGSTLLLVTVLSGLLYWAVSAKLRDGSIEQLEGRAASLQRAAMLMPFRVGVPSGFSVNVTEDPARPGFVFGGDASGTLALIAKVDPVTGTVDPKVAAAPPGVFVPADDEAVLAAATRGEQTIEELELLDIPIRRLTTAFDVGGSRFVAQVVGDRTTEIRTLQALLVLLVTGSLAVVAGAAAVGYVYAGRALVPIRESLRRQREFAADASHELRNPLAIVGAAIEHLRRGRDDPATIDRAIVDLAHGSERMNRLVDDLLFLARADAEAVQLIRGPTDLAEISADAIADLVAAAEARGVRLRLDVEPSPIVGDQQRLRQLVGILVDNAIRHSPAGAAVTVRARPGAELTVDDSGPGIRPEDLQNVFRRFWRAPGAPEGGTGLGLAIADWIVHSHSGRMQVANRPEGGARFSVALPSVD